MARGVGGVPRCMSWGCVVLELDWTPAAIPARIRRFCFLSDCEGANERLYYAVGSMLTLICFMMCGYMCVVISSKVQWRGVERTWIRVVERTRNIFNAKKTGPPAISWTFFWVKYILLTRLLKLTFLSSPPFLLFQSCSFCFPSANSKPRWPKNLVLRCHSRCPNKSQQKSEMAICSTRGKQKSPAR